mgnify:FL=1
MGNDERGIIHAVETLAHSVGVSEPRQIKRSHIRMMQDNGQSVSLADLFPRPDVAIKD